MIEWIETKTHLIIIGCVWSDLHYSYVFHCFKSYVVFHTHSRKNLYLHLVLFYVFRFVLVFIQSSFSVLFVCVFWGFEDGKTRARERLMEFLFEKAFTARSVTKVEWSGWVIRPFFAPTLIWSIKCKHLSHVYMNRWNKRNSDGHRGRFLFCKSC